MVPWIASVRQNQFQLLGETENIGIGGVCVLSDGSVPVNAVLRCELGLPGAPIGIPTLMQVRWASEAADKKGFRLGLQFLL